MGDNLYFIRDEKSLCDEVLAFLDVLLKFWETSIKKFLLFGREIADREYFFNAVRLHVKRDDEPKKKDTER